MPLSHPFEIKSGVVCSHQLRSVHTNTKESVPCTSYIVHRTSIRALLQLPLPLLIAHTYAGFCRTSNDITKKWNE